MPQSRTRTTVGLFLVLSGVIVWGWSHWFASDEPLSARPAQLVSDTDGTIAAVHCHVNSAPRAALRNARLVSSIVNALPSRVDVVLTMNDPAEFTVASNPFPNRVQLVDVPQELSFTIWPQDPFLVVQNGDDSRTLVVSADFQRADDQSIAASIARHLGYGLETSPLHFEGGNIVSDTKTVFIGANTIYVNAERLEISSQETVKRFERLVGRSVMVVGPYPQPIGHLDLFLTPLGKGRVALADPERAADLARRELDEQPHHVKQFEVQCESNFFGTPDIQQVTDVDGNTIKPPTIQGRTEQAIRDSRQLVPILDELARTLSERGYEVQRVPFLFARDPNPEDPTESTKPAGPGYPMLTYNNVLIESDEGTLSVYVPQYGWVAMDQAALAAWKTMGAQVVPVPGFEISAMYGGSLRCCSKVLGRN